MTLDQMWTRLESHQSYANQRGYGPAWARMCVERTDGAATAAAAAAAAEGAEYAVDAVGTAWAAVGAMNNAVRGALAAWAVKWIEQAEKVA